MGEAKKSVSLLAIKTQGTNHKCGERGEEPAFVTPDVSHDHEGERKEGPKTILG